MKQFICKVGSSFKPGSDLSQFAESEEFSNMWAFKIFELKALLLVLNSRKIFECDNLLSDIVAKSVTQKPLLSLENENLSGTCGAN